jgi:uncharacterized protein DUF6338
VPSTLAGFVLFVIGLAPGLVFVLAQQRVAPHQTLSTFRETAVVVCVSLAVDAVVLAAFAGVRAIQPHGTPDVGRLVRDPSVYLRESYLLVFWWSVVLLVVAVALAAWVGSGAVRRALSRLPGVSLAAQADPHESRMSAWWLLFRDQPHQPDIWVHLGCNLVDGSFVSGWLLSYNMSADDVADRDITLAAPIHYRPPGASEVDELVRTSAVVVSARQLSVLFVSHQRHGPRDRRSSGPAANARSVADE